MSTEYPPAAWNFVAKLSQGREGEKRKKNELKNLSSSYISSAKSQPLESGSPKRQLLVQTTCGCYLAWKFVGFFVQVGNSLETGTNIQNSIRIQGIAKNSQD